eukprot:TRINITY_DN14223_c0_g1_i1.p1 TRINITY_DN14223_c0_g1~~TRINITY_DN14223_c0_g1_i1.p1  ORF type:complete len:711 (-),score=231.77 TRINITY_DN14223_c0_g1_i1:103-2190(-)
MLTPSALLRSSVKATRTSARVVPQIQRRAGHGHDHHEDLSHLERPAFTPANFSLLADLSAPEAQPEYINKFYQDPFNNGEWIVKFINSTTALKCLAEINGTEFHHELKGSVLTQVYKDQLAAFEATVAPALEAEGLPKKAIDRLHYIYSTRAHVDEWEIDAAIKRFSFLGKQQSTWRVVTSGQESWPTWKKLFTSPFLNTGAVRPEFLASEQAFGRFPASNEAAAVLNVIKFRGLVAFVNAVIRGLTDEERKKVRDVLVQPRIPIRIDEARKASLEQFIEEIKSLATEDVTAAEKKLSAAWKNLGAQEKLFFYKKAKNVLPKALVPHQDEHDITHHSGEAETFLDEGIDYFTNEADRQAAVANIRKQFFDIFNNSYSRIQQSGDAVAKAFAEKFQAALNAFFSPEVQGDIELLTLMRSSDLSERQLEEIFSIFRDKSFDAASHDLLMDAINPHPVSRRLFGERIRLLAIEPVEYTKQFHDGEDSVWAKPGYYPAGTEDLLTHDTFKAPPVAPGPFNTAMDEVMHLKLKRLATDFYGLDLDTDIGMATFEQLVHTFDISPGEETLDRTLTSPPDHHTFEELPIMKFDGWSESDELPPASEVDSLEPALIEAKINEWLKEVSERQGTPYKPIRELAANLELDEVQLARLRAVLTYETHDRERIHMMKKIWSVVVPEKQLNLLFTEKEEKLLASEEHH